MPNRRQLLLLGGAAALVVGGALLLAPEDLEDAPPAGGEGPVFPGLVARLPEARRIELVRPEGMLVIERRGEAWVLPDSGGYRVRPSRVRELLTALTELRLVERRTADPAQLGRLGLEDPTRPGAAGGQALRVLDAEGRPIAALLVGRRRTRSQGNLPEAIYVRRPGEDQAWLAEGRLPLESDPQLWIDRDLANIPAERILRVEATRLGGAPPVVLVRAAGAPPARLLVEAPADIPEPEEVTLDEVARAFEYLTFLEVLPEAEIPGTPLGIGRFGLEGGTVVVVRPSLDPNGLWIRLRAEGEGEEAAALNARWGGWAYKVGIWKEKAFLPRPEDLRPRPAATDAPAPQPR